MKLIFHQNLSPALSERLQYHYPGSTHVQDALWRGASDDSIWFRAKEYGFVVVTKDRDYLDLSRDRGHPPKVILICTGNSPNTVVESLLRDHYDEIVAFELDPDRGIIELG